MKLARFSIFVFLYLAPQQTVSFSMKMSAKSTLYDVPVSNNGARCRLILYKKKISVDEVAIVSPMELGGLRSPEYLGLNPQGKMPLLSIKDGMNIPESDTICRYLMSSYNDSGPGFLPDNPKSNLISRIHDMYITTIQGALYKPSPPFGTFGTRSDALNEIQRQLQIIDNLIDDDKKGTYLCGNEVSLADVTLFPTMIFVDSMFPKFGIDDAIPSKIMKWFKEVQEEDSDFAKVYNEVQGGLDSWQSSGRWDTIWMAGIRDEEAPTIFNKLIDGEIPADIVYQDEKVFAFKDIDPAAPAHLLVIPKDRMGLSNLRKASQDHIEILGNLLLVAGNLAKNEELGFGDGARIVINDGQDGGQEVPHLHVHVLGGRPLSWPPG